MKLTQILLLIKKIKIIIITKEN